MAGESRCGSSNARAGSWAPLIRLWQNVLFFSSLVAILIFATWGESADPDGLWYAIFSIKWLLASLSAFGLAVILVRWFEVPLLRLLMAAVPIALLALLVTDRPLIAFAAGVVELSLIASTSEGEPGEWFGSSWDFDKQILPLLFIGVLLVGVRVGRPGTASGL